MPAVHKKVASKDYPGTDIKKGDTYYSWQLYRQPVQRSLKPPRPSQLTTGKRSTALAALEALHDATDGASCPDDIAQALETCAEEIRGVAEEYRESVSNMEEAFPNGSPTIEQCNEKADALEEFANACDDAKSTVESLKANDIGDGDAPEDLAFEDASEELKDAWLDECREEVHSLDLEV